MRDTATIKQVEWMLKISTEHYWKGKGRQESHKYLDLVCLQKWADIIGGWVIQALYASGQR